MLIITDTPPIVVIVDFISMRFLHFYKMSIIGYALSGSRVCSVYAITRLTM